MFAVKCGSYGGSGGEVLGGLRRWWFDELGGEVWGEVVVWVLGILKVEGGLGVGGGCGCLGWFAGEWEHGEGEGDLGSFGEVEGSGM